MTHHGRHRKRHIAGRFAAAIAILAVLLGTAWAVNAFRGSDSPDRSSRTHVESMKAAVARATDTCREARDLFTDDIVAMHGAIQQWRLHIDAMTQLVNGKIDLAQAIAFWDSTRVEGKRSLALWNRVDGRYLSARASCEAPAPTQGSANELEACHDRQVATDVVLGDARVTLADWKMHIRDMEALRAGKIGATRAIHMWHRMYNRGKVALARYDKDHRSMDQVAECSL